MGVPPPPPPREDIQVSTVESDSISIKNTPVTTCLYMNKSVKPTIYFIHAHLRVRFFGKIQNWIIDLRSHGYFAPKETKNPKMDFCHDNGVNTFCTEHKNFRTNLLSVECILAKFISAYKIFHKNHATKLLFFSLEHNVARNASESEECLQNDQCQLHS